jgi:hypothetical protein
MERYQWRLRVRATDRGRATVFVRTHQFTVGRPVTFDAEDDAISALEYVLGAIGAEIVHGLQTLARRRQLAIDQLEASVHGELNNPLTALGVVGEAGHPGLEVVGITVYLASSAPAEDIQRLWQEVLARSPLVRTLQPAIRLELQYQVVL